MTDVELKKLEKEIAALEPSPQKWDILDVIAELRARTALLEEIYAEIGEKRNGACNVCSTYTHKHWCYYPKLVKILGKPMDAFDMKALKLSEEL